MIKTYIVALLVFLGIDAIWLGLIAKNLYQKEIGSLLKTEVNWIAALIFYLLFIVGVTVFVIEPSLEKSSLSHAVMLGALFGLIAYATYDLTNLATLKDWSLKITIIDMIWGAFLGAATSGITYLLIQK